jgi:hypothetical protein
LPQGQDSPPFERWLGGGVEGVCRPAKGLP